MTEQWMSIVEYARACNISDMTVRRRIKTGKLSAKLIDNKYYIPISAVAEGRLPEAPTPAPQHRSVAPPSQRSTPVVIKAHPAAHKTINPPTHTPHNNAGYIPTSAYAEDDDQPEGLIPSSLTRGFQHRETTSVETKALLAFCEASLKKAAETERRTVDKFKAKLEALEAVIHTRDLEVKTLRQEVEDLQMLVKYLDPAKAGTRPRS